MPTFSRPAMLKIEAAGRLVQSETMYQYETRLTKELGLKPLGWGACSVVFQHPTIPEVAVKIYQRDKAFDSFIKFCTAHKANSYLPRIDSVYNVSSTGELLQIFDSTGAKPDKKFKKAMTILFMEKLTPVDKDTNCKFVDYLFSLLGKKSPHTTVEKFLANNSFWYALGRQKRGPDLAEFCAWYVDGVLNKHLGINDIGDNNIMRRDNQIVFIDPMSPH